MFGGVDTLRYKAMDKTPMGIWDAYTIDRVVGRGGMGVVYKATHSRHGPVALKTVLPGASSFATQSILAETEILAQLEHPGVVRLLDHGVHEDVPWMALEFLEGKTMQAWLSPSTASNPQEEAPSSDTMTMAEALTLKPIHRRAWVERSITNREQVLGWIVQVCQALASVHSQGLLHADVKPHNIMVTESGRAVLIDFGLAKRFGSRLGQRALEVAGLKVGSLDYMSPEQYAGHALDARTDLYAVGCILFEVLTGQVLARVGYKTHLLEGVSLELSQLVETLLAPDPYARPNSAQAVLQILGGVGVPTPTLNTPHLFEPPPRPMLGKADLVGRENLWAALMDRLRETIEGQGQMVMLEGESGVGKTRLAFELVREARVSFKAHALVGYGLAPVSPPAGALTPILRAAADVCVSQGSSQTLALLPPRDAAVLIPYAPFLRKIPGVGADTALPELPPEAAQLRLYTTLETVLRRLFHGRLLVLVLDDLQWADELSLGFLAHMASRLDRLRWMIIGTYRADEATDALRTVGERCNVVHVGRLAQSAVVNMMAQMLGPGTDEALSTRIAERSNGNPFFVAEYLQMLVDEQVLELNPQGGFAVRDTFDDELGRLPTPDAIDLLLSNRLRRLSPGLRLVCEAAAVLGRRFERTMLDKISPIVGSALDAVVADLIRRQIIERDAHTQHIQFVHAMFQEVTLGLVSPETRSHIHRLAAQALHEQGNPANKSAEAHHWHQGGERVRACACYAEAAHDMKLRGAIREARSLYTSALELAEPNQRESIRIRLEFASLLTSESIHEQRHRLVVV
ncbi:MAG: protein kinase [Myxococcota bacterium]